MKKIIYSVLVGPYDSIAPAVPFDGWEYVLFTDQPISPQGWQVRPLEWTCGCPIRTSRYHKILMPPKADITIYIDANMTLNVSPDSFMQKGLGLRLHPSRQNMIEEAKAVIEMGLDSAMNVASTVLNYSADFAPFTENGVIVRNGNSSDFMAFNNIWWNEYCRASHRDQLTLPWVLQIQGITPFIIDYLAVSCSNTHLKRHQTC